MYRMIIKMIKQYNIKKYKKKLKLESKIKIHSKKSFRLKYSFNEYVRNVLN